MRRNSISRLAMISAPLIAGFVQAQQPASPPASQRPQPDKVAIPGSNFEIVFGMAEWLPGSRTDRHAHPGVVMVYLADGAFWYLIDGETGRPHRVGDISHVPELAFPGEGQRSTAVPVMALYIIEKEKPAAAAAVTPSQ